MLFCAIYQFSLFLAEFAILMSDSNAQVHVSMHKSFTGNDAIRYWT